MLKLTKKQSKVLDYIAETVIENGTSPTLKEIGEHFSTSASAAYYTVLALSQKGLLTLNKGKRRAITLPEKSRGERENVSYPFFSKEPTVEELKRGTEKTILLPRFYRKDDIFSYCVTSTSMIGAGILPGDTVVLKRASSASDNDIALAERTEDQPLELRRVHIASSYTELWAENDTNGIIRRKNFVFYGILVALIRHY